MLLLQLRGALCLFLFASVADISWSVSDRCVVPETPVCNVTYSVPPSIAATAAILESEITSAYNSDKDNGISETCARSLREVRCAKSFPRCSNDSTNVTVTSLDCAQRLKCATTNYRNALNAVHFCDLAEKTFSFPGSCKPMTQYGYVFSSCPVNVSRNVSEWMFALLQYQDIFLTSTINPFLSQNSPDCAESYAYYTCAKIGQCDGCGTNNRMYTRERCNTSQNMYVIL